MNYTPEGGIYNTQNQFQAPVQNQAHNPMQISAQVSIQNRQPNNYNFYNNNNFHNLNQTYGLPILNQSYNMNPTTFNAKIRSNNFLNVNNSNSNQINPNNNFIMNTEQFIEYKLSKSSPNMNIINDFEVKKSFLKKVCIIKKIDFDRINNRNFSGNTFYFTTVNEIVNVIKNDNFDFYFVKEDFFKIKCIQVLPENLVEFYKDDNKIVLFFPNEKNNNKALEIKIKTESNNQIKNKLSMKNPKEAILEKLILLYAFEKEFIKLMKKPIEDEYDMNEYYLINEEIIQMFKHEFFYSDICKILQNNINMSFKGYVKNMPDLLKINEFKKILNYPIFDDMQKYNNTFKNEQNFVAKLTRLNYFNQIQLPINFIIIPENLFNLFFNDFTQHSKEKNFFKYNVLMGNDFLSIQKSNINNIFTFYDLNKQNGKLEAICSIKYNLENNFYHDVKYFIIGKTFNNYLNGRNMDLDEINKSKILFDNNTQIGEYIMMKKNIDEISNIKNLINENRSILNEYNSLMNDIINLPGTNLEINNINDIQNNLNNFNALKCIIVYDATFEPLKKAMFFDQLNTLEAMKNHPSYNQSEQNIINEIYNDKTKIRYNLKQLASKISMFEGKKSDKDITGKFLFSFINFDLLVKMTKSPIFESTAKQNIFFIFKNNDIYYAYSANSKKLFKVNFSNELKFSLEEVIFIVKKGPYHCLGLENIGATCYMNATLQCLCNVTNLKKYFLNKDSFLKDIQNKDCPLAIEFYNVINNLWKESFNGKNYYTPTSFKDKISEMNPLFKGIAANDSKDLILFLYETIHNELNSAKDQDNQNNINNEIQDDSIEPELQELRSEYYPKNSSILIKTFYFEHKNEMKCLNCECVKSNYNINNMLIFPLEKVREYMAQTNDGKLEKVTLEDCFENYKVPETLNGNNQIYCNNCNQMADASNRNLIYSSPEVLTIILNRGKGLQFDVNFEYPLIININNYILDKTSPNNNYELIGVLCHIGPSGMSGHFIAICKSPENGKWYLYNDAMVSEVKDPRYTDNDSIERIPYVLYYQKIRKNIPNNNIFTLYINYYDKQFYIDIEKNAKIQEIINRIIKKYEIPNNIQLYLNIDNNLILLDPNSIVGQNSNIKDNSNLIAKIF